MDRQEPIRLDPQDAEYIRHQIEAGRFKSPSEVIGEAIRQMRDAEENPEIMLGMTNEEIRRQIEEGAAAADRGELLDGDAVMDELDRLDREERAKLKKRAS
jgi:putative addiction module CopG family antidote